MTELNMILAALDREGIKYEMGSSDDGGTELAIRTTYTEAILSFRADGSLEHVGSGE